jgi:hypothetical protein
MSLQKQMKPVKVAALPHQRRRGLGIRITSIGLPKLMIRSTWRDGRPAWRVKESLMGLLRHE